MKSRQSTPAPRECTLYRSSERANPRTRTKSIERTQTRATTCAGARTHARVPKHALTREPTHEHAHKRAHPRTRAQTNAVATHRKQVPTRMRERTSDKHTHAPTQNYKGIASLPRKCLNDHQRPCLLHALPSRQNCWRLRLPSLRRLQHQPPNRAGSNNIPHRGLILIGLEFQKELAANRH